MRDTNKYTSKKRIVEARDYPELRLILWDWGADTISEEDAFRIYEQRWKHVDQAQITLKEQKFIDYLTKRYGNGVFLSA